MSNAKLAFAAGLGMLVYASASGVLSSPEPLRVGVLKSGEPPDDTRASNPALLGKEVKAIDPRGRPNVFAFPSPKTEAPPPPPPPPPITLPSERVLPPPPPGDHDVDGPKKPDERIVRKDLPVLFRGILDGRLVYFSDRKTPDKVMEFRVGETIPDHDFEIVRATRDSVVLKTPQGEMVELVVFGRDVNERPPGGGPDVRIDQSGKQGPKPPDAGVKPKDGAHPGKEPPKKTARPPEKAPAGGAGGGERGPAPDRGGMRPPE